MSTEESATSHLTQQELSEKDRLILRDLESWLSQAKFEKKKENIELCVDKALNEKWALLRNMDSIKRVRGNVAKSIVTADEGLVYSSAASNHTSNSS